MFLFLSNLMQNFTFSWPHDDVPSKDFKDVALSGVTNMARDFKIIATPREK